MRRAVRHLLQGKKSQYQSGRDAIKVRMAKAVEALLNVIGSQARLHARAIEARITARMAMTRGSTGLVLRS